MPGPYVSNATYSLLEAKYNDQVERTTADDFTFDPIVDTLINVYSYSNTVSISGIEKPPVTILAPGADYSINGGAWASGSVLGYVTNGDTLSLRVMAPSTRGTSYTVTAIVSATSEQWTITTEIIPVKPNYPITIGDAPVHPNAEVVWIPVVSSHAVDRTQVLSYSMSNGKGVNSPANFINESGYVVFQPGETSKLVPVKIVTAFTEPANETMSAGFAYAATVTLNNPVVAISDTSNINNGDTVTGMSAIPNGTVVLSKTSSTVTLDKNPTFNQTGTLKFAAVSITGKVTKDSPIITNVSSTASVVLGMSVSTVIGSGNRENITPGSTVISKTSNTITMSAPCLHTTAMYVQVAFGAYSGFPLYSLNGGTSPTVYVYADPSSLVPSTAVINEDIPLPPYPPVVATHFTTDFVTGWTLDGVTTTFDNGFASASGFQPDGVTPCFENDLAGNNRIQYGNNEFAYYCDPSLQQGVNPYPVISGKRTIQAEYFPGKLRNVDNSVVSNAGASNAGVYPEFYVSTAVLRTKRMCNDIQLGHIVECDYLTPVVKLGYWPAFWLVGVTTDSQGIPRDAAPPELDVEELYGKPIDLISPDNASFGHFWNAYNGVSVYSSEFPIAKYYKNYNHRNAYHKRQSFLSEDGLSIVTYRDGVAIWKGPNNSGNSSNRPLRNEDVRWQAMVNIAVGGAGAGTFANIDTASMPWQLPLNSMSVYVAGTGAPSITPTATMTNPIEITGSIAKRGTAVAYVGKITANYDSVITKGWLRDGVADGVTRPDRIWLTADIGHSFEYYVTVISTSGNITVKSSSVTITA